MCEVQKQFIMFKLIISTKLEKVCLIPHSSFFMLYIIFGVLELISTLLLRNLEFPENMGGHHMDLNLNFIILFCSILMVQRNNDAVQTRLGIHLKHDKWIKQNKTKHLPYFHNLIIAWL